MFLHKRITPQQKHDILVCPPKSTTDKTPDGYRPITLLNTEYKLLAQIMAQRMRHILRDQLAKSQYCGVSEESILEAVTTVRDAIAYAETKNLTLCILTLDFQHAFDHISHQCLFHVLHRYGISEWFIERIRASYEKATTAVQINGSLA
jgi:hypothetical protein